MCPGANDRVPSEVDRYGIDRLALAIRGGERCLRPERAARRLVAAISGHTCWEWRSSSRISERTGVFIRVGHADWTLFVVPDDDAVGPCTKDSPERTTEE